MSSSNKPLESISYKGFEIQIFSDDSPLNPREEFDNVGVIVHWHRDYQLGENIRGVELRYPCASCNAVGMIKTAPATLDPCPNCNGEGEIEVKDLSDLETYLHIVREAVVILPLALLDHSGLHLYVSSSAHWCDPGGWDSGQVGFIYCTKEKLYQEWGGARKVLEDAQAAEVCDESAALSLGTLAHEEEQKAIELAEACLRSEVEIFDDYLSNNVYGYQIIDEEGEELEDGSCWGFYGYDHEKSGLLEAAKSSIDYEVERREGPKEFAFVDSNAPVNQLSLPLEK